LCDVLARDLHLERQAKELRLVDHDRVNAARFEQVLDGLRLESLGRPVARAEHGDHVEIVRLVGDFDFILGGTRVHQRFGARAVGWSDAHFPRSFRNAGGAVVKNLRGDAFARQHFHQQFRIVFSVRVGGTKYGHQVCHSLRG